MRAGGRISAAIEVLENIFEHYQPSKMALREWGKRARYAGAQDRAFVSGLVLDALRVKGLACQHMGDKTARAVVFATLVLHWEWSLKTLEAALDMPHSPPKLNRNERQKLVLAPDPTAPLSALGSFPDWLEPHIQRAFGDAALIETQAMMRRAPVDIRVNTLRAGSTKVGDALQRLGGVPSRLLKHGFQIPAPETSKREAAISAIPAYSKGWLEIQDIGSQIAAVLSGVQPGESVLDYCAGGGGKALAFAAHMQGEGKVYAYDIDGRRLSALIPRQIRANAKNIVLCHPQEPDNPLHTLKGKMDCVFVDAPCSGTGTWRRKPDTKWRLKPAALDRRREQQAQVLKEAAHYTRPGGRLIYVTCSFLREEGEDQITHFLKAEPSFACLPFTPADLGGEHFTPTAKSVLACGLTSEGFMRLSPQSSGTDGFFIARLVHQSPNK